ncbi:MAG: sulfite exporter TauE/SafE family protein [Parachlamydia sp.]|nr:sulfite exporter TauE/SafE family protein [Parachlamydia sp.]
MTLLLTMLPLYLFGNLHCLGMCGPLVMMIGQHRYRFFYFLGRTLSFTLAGALAGAAGLLLQVALKESYIPALICFFFGGFLLFLSFRILFGLSYPGAKWLSQRFASTNRSLSLLMLRDQPLATFLFGFFTLLLPCGQTLVVYSACALSQDPSVGLLNGFAFALLTSPSLFMAMQVRNFLPAAKAYYNTVVGLSALAVAILALCRGLAELEIIPHLAFAEHLVIY